MKRGMASEYSELSEVIPHALIHDGFTLLSLDGKLRGNSCAFITALKSRQLNVQINVDFS